MITWFKELFASLSRQRPTDQHAVNSYGLLIRMPGGWYTREEIIRTFTDKDASRIAKLRLDGMGGGVVISSADLYEITGSERLWDALPGLNQIEFLASNPDGSHALEVLSDLRLVANWEFPERNN